MEKAPAESVQLIKKNLKSVRQRITSACDRTNRRPDDLTVVAVTKTFPVEIVQAGIEAGLRDFGENRVQELVAKSDAVRGKALGGEIAWHQIGPVQSNKAGDVAQRADLFHALDRRKIASRLDRFAEEANRILPCLVQVNVSGEDSKFGISPDELGPFLDDMAAFSNLKIIGLMTLAAPAANADELETIVRPQFRLLADLAKEHDGQHGGAELTELSMGMSGDFEIAIEEGATMIRIGSVLFGPRDD